MVFTSNRTYKNVSGVDVFAMNTDGSGLTRITRNLIPNGCEECCHHRLGGEDLASHEYLTARATTPPRRLTRSATRW